jgi:hypothetical protein
MAADLDLAWAKRRHVVIPMVYKGTGMRYEILNTQQ